MSQLIIRFSRRDVIYTLFINDNYVGLITFLISLISIIILKKIFKRFKSRKKNLPKPNLRIRGGDHLLDCIQPNTAYEIIDKSLKDLIFEMLKIDGKNGPTFVTVPVFLLAYAAQQSVEALVTTGNIIVLAENVRAVAGKSLVGLVSGILIGLGFTVNPIIPTIGITAICALALQLVFGSINCSALVSPLARAESISKLEPVRHPFYLDCPENKLPGPIIVKVKDRGVEIFSSSKEKESTTCLENINADGSITRSFETTSQYNLSDKPTYTLDDVKKYDSTEIKAKAQLNINRYETNRKQFNRNYIPLSKRTKTINDLRPENSIENTERRQFSSDRSEQQREKIKSSSSKDNEL